MDNKIIQFLKIVQEGRDRQGAIQYSIPDELPEGYNMSNVRYYQELGLIGKEGKILHLTPLGYQTLNSAYSLEISKETKEINKEMSNNTKIMKNLTKWIIRLTFTMIGLIIVQIILNFI